MEAPSKSNRLLNPLVRNEEILFGLIMTLTFTCSISIAHARTMEIRQLLIGAIGCNLAWGIVDATMYLIGVLAHRTRNKALFDFVKGAADKEQARKLIADALPGVIASAMGNDDLEKIRSRLISLSESTGQEKLTLRHVKKAMGMFLLVFVSTFPVVIPFVVMKDTLIALRISNLIAIVMMFLCGWSMASYVGLPKWIVSIAMVIIGIILVAITIALGG